MLRLAAVIAGLSAAAPALGQLPPVAAPDPLAAGAVAAGAAPKNLWSFFCLTPDQKLKCKAHFCTSPAGQLVNSLLKPAGGLTGGLIGPICPPASAANPENLKKPADSAQGAAARIKAEEAQAAAKVADLEYLATKNCKRYPEAEAALINGLRAEKNECVRLAAAKALARGCCCSLKVIKALTIVVNGTTADAFPAEDSPRVKLAAFVALERCLAACDLPAEKPPEVPGKNDGEVLPATYYTVLFDKLKPADVFAEARTALANGLALPADAMPRAKTAAGVVTAPPSAPAALLPPPARPKTLFDVVRKARG